MAVMTDAAACDWLTDKLEAVLAGHHCPVRLQTEPYGEHGYRSTATGRVPKDLAALMLLTVGAARLTIEHVGDRSVITLE